MPVEMRARPTFADRTIEPLEARKKRQAFEGSQAMKDYRRSQEAARERMATLRAERLAREAQAQAQAQAKGGA